MYWVSFIFWTSLKGRQFQNISQTYPNKGIQIGIGMHSSMMSATKASEKVYICLCMRLPEMGIDLDTEKSLGFLYAMNLRFIIVP
jgi:hypothetical protein